MKIFFASLVVVAAAVLSFVVLQYQKRRVTGLQRKRILALWQALDAVEAVPMKVLHADAVLAQVLESAGFSGTVGEMLRAAGPRFTDENAVWKAHKLRNVIAHEPTATVTPKQADVALRAFKKAIYDLL